jgi:NADH-quinone oxidoreductase subunit F/NADP-reducing hydrogenase subunit HndC
VLDTAPPPSYVVVCRGPHCRERGSLPLRQRLVQLLRGQDQARLVGYACFGQCELGPNVAFYPPGVWYGGLTRPGDAERVIQHALGSRRLAERPLVLPEQERREHLANIAELVATLERDRQRGPWWRRWLPVPSRG